MNRLILVGNGFDCAHGLQTKYAEFINWYFGHLLDAICEEGSNIFKDHSLFEFKCKHNGLPLKTLLATLKREGLDGTTKDKIDFLAMQIPNASVRYSPLLRNITQAIETKNWVDIENEYYALLKELFRGNSQLYSTADKLNIELNYLKEKLAKYLCEISEEKINNKIVFNDIKSYMLAPFSVKDIAVEGRKALYDHIASKWNYAEKDWVNYMKGYCRECASRYGELKAFTQKYESYDDYLQQDKEFEQLPSEFLFPERMMLLNFNYTATADLYIPKDDGFIINHIHGDLSAPDKMIFGYGDELDEYFDGMMKKNDNSFLANIKSVRYLETDNYRKMLSFIDSSPYQIYLMGHSCGNSDRTLLNTLFEHENCVSIKVFYRKMRSGKDNYIELIENILRNFTDARRMRDRVVNKSYCYPMPDHSSEPSLRDSSK